MQLSSVELIIAGLYATNYGTNRVCDEFAKVFLRFVLQINVVLKLFRDPVLNLVM